MGRASCETPLIMLEKKNIHRNIDKEDSRYSSKKILLTGYIGNYEIRVWEVKRRAM